MPEERSTVRTRELGYVLRSAMTNVGLSAKATAIKLDWSESRVSRFLTGKLPLSEVDASAMAAIFDITGAERDYLLQLARDLGKLSWSAAEQRRTLTDHQNRATRITEFAALSVPALLHTADYAYSVFVRAVPVQSDAVASRVAGRRADQGVLDLGKPPQCRFFINDAALRLPVGGPQVMAAQLHHLLRMGDRPHIDIRVIPHSAGAHAGLAGSCCLMEFAGFGPVVAIQHDLAGYFLEEPAQIAIHEKIFSSLSAIALGKTESHRLIRRLAVDVFEPAARNMAPPSQRTRSGKGRSG